MNAYTIAREMLGGMDLTPMQVAQLRAIDHEHQQRLFALLHAPHAEPHAGPGRAATPEELASLRASLESGIRGILTPAQRARLQEHSAEAGAG
jgi:Spy/CpxP family protein refolding chaperone